MTKPLQGDKLEIAILRAELNGFSELIDVWKEMAESSAQAIESIRKIHRPFMMDEPYCSECHSYEIDEKYASYPCPTIRALDGEQQ